MNWFLHHAKRIARISAGLVLVGVGLFLSIPGIPGPGLLVVFAGLSVLAIDFVWAHRLKRKIQDTTMSAVNKVRGRPSEQASAVAAPEPDRPA